MDGSPPEKNSIPVGNALCKTTSALAVVSQSCHLAVSSASKFLLQIAVFQVSLSCIRDRAMRFFSCLLLCFQRWILRL